MATEPKLNYKETYSDAFQMGSITDKLNSIISIYSVKPHQFPKKITSVSVLKSSHFSL